MNPAFRALGAYAERLIREYERRAPEHALAVAGWHRVDGLPGGLSTSPDEFRRHLDLLDGWHVLSLEDGLRRLRDGTLPERAVALTFDDGYASVADVAWPLLRERGWPATLYAVSGYLDGGKRFPWDADDSAPLLSAAALKDLHDDGMAVGSHTVTHRWLPHLSATEVRTEVTDSKAALEDLLGAPVPSFSYPMGGWNDAVVAAVAAAGYDTAVTVDRGRVWARRLKPLRVNRAFAPRDVADLRRTLSGAYTFLRPLDRWRIRNGPAF